MRLLKITLPALLSGIIVGNSWGTVATMPVEELRRGMRGIGRTVFQGTRIDTFQVEILGVLHNAIGPRSDLILARLSGGPLSNTGVILGMSGSPVYIDGKLVGAVSYRVGAFAKEPIAGITPIAAMVDLFNRPSAPEGVSSAARLTETGARRLVDLTGMNAAELTPISLPIVISGFARQAVAEFRHEFSRMGWTPVQGGGGMDPGLPSGAFEPGAAMGVQLVRGDLSVTGIGTLTHRDGDRVVGFGHSMIFGGATALPMTAAYIHEVLPSQYASFKLGVVGETIGAIVQDRAPGIAGTIGLEVDMMPAQINLRSPGKQAQFRMEVLRNRDLSPTLLRMAVFSAMISSEKLTGEVTVKSRVRIDLNGRPSVEAENVYAGPLGLSNAVLGVTTPLAKLIRNPFEPVKIERVTFDLDVEAERAHTARIKSIGLQKTSFQPGDTVRVTVSLKPYWGGLEEVQEALVIPNQTPGGRLILRVSSASAHGKQEAKRAPGEYNARDLDHLIRLLGRVGRNNEMVVELLSGALGVTIEGREVSRLPSSVLSVLQFSRSSDAVKRVLQTVVQRARIPTDYVLSGSQVVVLNVNRKRNGVVFAEGGSAGDKGK
jgi:hypothetical protein